MQKILVLTISVVLLLSSSVGYALAEKTPDWTHMHGDAYHTGYSNHELPPPLQLLWKKDFAGSPYANVVACWDGNTPKIFVGDVGVDARTGAQLYCLEPSTGRIIWKYKVGDGEIPASPTIYTSKAGQMRVLVISSGILQNRESSVVLHCLTTEGDVVWKQKLNGSSSQSTPTVQNGYIYVASTIFAGDSSKGGHLYKLNAETGATVWRTTLPDA
ncbi:MAG: PQQ-like beta-propeller repeat protein, partial [Caldisericia bacterium]|nr:PQQ-like beta-propeller repeat protein [Caldisericia bacterium]